MRQNYRLGCCARSRCEISYGRNESLMRPSQIAPAPQAKILVVDDRPANLLSVRAVLEPLGQEIIEAHSGEEALRQLLAHDVAGDVLLGGAPREQKREEILEDRHETRLYPGT